MMHIGAYNIHPFLPVVNKKTDNAINTKDANNWFAAPNNGQMLLYPPKHNKNPKNNVITVETPWHTMMSTAKGKNTLSIVHESCYLSVTHKKKCKNERVSE